MGRPCLVKVSGVSALIGKVENAHTPLGSSFQLHLFFC
jgi:hypothetical protein